MIVPRKVRLLDSPRRLWCAAFALCGAMLAAAASGQGLLQPSVQFPDQIGITPRLGNRVPLELEFTDADGRTSRLGDGLGSRPVILHLVYYQCPMLCKLSSDGLLRALDTLSLKPGQDFSIVTVSFDPREGPELSAGARQVAIERYGREAVEQGWRFLTGDEAAIAALCESVGFRYKYDEELGQFAHASGIFVLTPDGTLSRFLSGVEFSPRDLRLALVDASAGNIGTATDQVLLMCYMYDPITGKYGLAIITLIRIAGIVTVIVMAAGICMMLRRERQTAATGAQDPFLAQSSN
jgi:protein SCO1/2